MPDSEMRIPEMAHFLRMLDTISKQLPRETEAASEDVARDWLGLARGKARRPQAIEVASQMTTGNTPGGTTIRNSHPGFFGEEFGGRSRPETMHFPPYKGQQGYWLFPAARANAGKLNRNWEDAVDAATKAWKN